MTSFLLEIFSEEIPARMQIQACENFKKTALEVLEKSDLNFKIKDLQTLVAPRRLVLTIKNLKETQKTNIKEIIGPKVDSNQRAIDGFLKSVKLNSAQDLQVIDHKDSKYYLFKQDAQEIQTENILKEEIVKILQKFTNSWPKLMRYSHNGKNIKWVRPVRNILCLLGEKIVNFEFFGINSNDRSYGNFLFSSEPITIESPLTYEKQLKNNFVIVNQDERKQEIINQIEEISSDLKLKTVDDKSAKLYDEVTGLCEYPTALVGRIEEKFMTLPQEILTLTLKQNQKFFCLHDKNNILSRNFIFICNSPKAKENEISIVKDNIKVSKARLQDAIFFVEDDLKKPLIEKVEGLRNVIFHEKLGSVYDRHERISDLAEFIALWISHCEISKIDQVAKLCKIDLLTKSVAEFPELQGKIGSFYAEKQGYDDEIVNAIQEHYLPTGPQSGTPSSPLGTSIAIADKIDLVVGMFLAGQKPTSSKDPYALRRAALGIIRICLKDNISIPFRVLVNKSIKSYKPKLVESLLKEDREEKKSNEKRRKLTEEVTKFFIDRLKSFLKESYQIRTDVLNSVIEDYVQNFDKHKYGDMVNLARRAAFVNQLVEKDHNKNIVELYKRSANVLAIEEKNDRTKFNGKVNRLSLKAEEEKDLFKKVKKIAPNFKKLIKSGEYEKSFDLLKELENPLAEFFDNVKVNDDNNKLRENRLNILSKIREMFLTVADLSQIEL